jgi:hypothetical protein
VHFYWLGPASVKPEQEMRAPESARNKSSSDIPSYPVSGVAGLIFCGTQPWLLEPEWELEDLPEHDLKNLLYEMSTEANPDA